VNGAKAATDVNKENYSTNIGSSALLSCVVLAFICTIASSAYITHIPILVAITVIFVTILILLVVILIFFVTSIVLHANCVTCAELSEALMVMMRRGPFGVLELVII
jgi:hypothetical protein